MCVCYDLRFPELYRALKADVLLVPSAFTHVTGQAHWELLLRARAVENLAYVVAPAQGGVHENGRRTWGHCMVVDPWGVVLAQQGGGRGRGAGGPGRRRAWRRCARSCPRWSTGCCEHRAVSALRRRAPWLPVARGCAVFAARALVAVGACWARWWRPCWSRWCGWPAATKPARSQSKLERDTADALSDIRSALTRNVQSLQALHVGPSHAAHHWRAEASVLLREHREWMRIEWRDADLATRGRRGHAVIARRCSQRLGRGNAQGEVRAGLRQRRAGSAARPTPAATSCRSRTASGWK